ncbi:hypothetical protein B0H10DRAFT_2131452 [Mycena sp. CBHHK59/15]|nr:hypothetical protein B0H10DRAFT_2131452 [Mycena sp. CBHHK59/15]
MDTLPLRKISQNWKVDQQAMAPRFVHVDNVQRTNETLIRHGYIGSSPEKVSLAFPLRLFEIYRQIHRVCPAQ